MAEPIGQSLGSHAAEMASGKREEERRILIEAVRCKQPKYLQVLARA